MKFHIDFQPTWRVACKDCLMYVVAYDVNDGHAFMASHKCAPGAAR